MADLSFSSTPIIGDLFDTAQEALTRSAELGCSGYRTYIVNGQTKYVPCSTYLEYDKTLRYYVQQGKLAAFGKDVFGDKLVGLQFANSTTEVDKGDPFFTLGNFTLGKSYIVQNTTATQVSQADPTQKFTANIISQKAGINSSQLVDFVNNNVQSNLTATILFDKRKLENYVLFSSLKERIKNTIIEITQDFPGGIKASPISILYPSVTNYVNLTATNRATFKVNIGNLFNPFGIDYTSKSLTKVDDPTLTPLRNFGKNYTDFVIYYNGTEYPIISVSLPTSTSDLANGLVITTNGRPFLDKLNTNNEANVLFYIKPSAEKFNEFFQNISDLGQFLLNYDETTQAYKSEFVVPETNDNGDTVLNKRAIYFPVYDEVNVNLFDSKFDDFLTQLNTISDDFDAYKTNLISRFLTTDSLKDFDTVDKKAQIIFNLYGRYFDDVKRYVDGLTYMTNLTYDKVENIPDVLVKNFAHMLGLETFEIEDQDTLIQSFFNTSDYKLVSDITPVELDIELWRRIAINAFYLFKSKGTRKSIEFILKIAGIPDYITEITEYVYLASDKVDPIDKLNKIYNLSDVVDPTYLLGVYPFDGDGYPTIPSNVAFQESGGYLTQDSQNVGPYDFGKKYLDAFRNFDSVKGFDIFRTIDNQKSWVYTETPLYRENDSDAYSTYYYEQDSRLSINTKELEVYLSSDRIIDHTIYKYYASNNINIDSTLSTGYTNPITPNSITFNQYLREVLEKYIPVETRKTIVTYPTLSKIYFDFLKLSGDYVTNAKALEFLGLFDTHWVNLIQQFIPATSIINTGKKIRNSSHLDNKFVYKHGENNDLAWLGTEGSEFQTTAKKPVYEGSSAVNSVGTLRQSITATPISVGLEGLIGKKIKGIDPTINQYFGVQYSNSEYCGTGFNFFKWISNKDYTTSDYKGNITSPSGATTSTSLLYNLDTTKLRRYGVFVTYHGELYRLNTVAAIRTYAANYPFGTSFYNSVGTIEPLTTIVTSGTTYYQTPDHSHFIYKNNSTNAVVLTYSGSPLYTHIPRYTNAKTITFPDCDGVNNPLPNSDEREYFLKSISMGFAHIDIGINFTCPSPPPHVCFYDYSGRTISLSSFNSRTGTTYPSIANYVDEYGTHRTIRQPKYYGYSKNIGTSKPSDYVFGKSGNWITPYKKRKIWTLGTTYYNGDLIEYLPTPNTTYVVTGTTVITGTSTTPVVSPTSGLKVSTTYLGDMYQNYSGRTTTDPLMHIDPAYINKINLDPTKNLISINLNKAFNLQYVYSGATSGTTLVVKDTVLDHVLYMNDNFIFDFDGFYTINPDNVGPFYEPRADEALILTLNDSLPLVANEKNYVSIQSLNTNFSTVSDNIALSVSNPGFFLVKYNSYLKFDFQLYFESSLNISQTVNLYLLDSNGIAVEAQQFSFSGNDLPDNRIYNFIYEGGFQKNQKLYFAIEPVTNDCTLSRYEVIDYVYNEPDRNLYNPVDDGRFRVAFNTGRKVNYGTDIEYGLSIAPLIAKYDAQTGTTTTNSIVGVDNYTYSDSSPYTNYYFLNTPRVAYNHSTDPVLMYNKLYVDYYKKLTNDPVITDQQKTLYDKDIKYDKVDFNFNIITKKLPYSIPSTKGYYASDSVYNITAADYYLGNVPEFYEGGSVTNNIIIGKQIGRRYFTVDNYSTYEPSKSTLNNKTIIGTGNTQSVQLFQAYDSGILDYTRLDLNNTNNIYGTRRVQITGTTYELENEVYSTDIYQQMLSVAEYFNPAIMNYNLNDIVKVTINNYKTVVVSTGGTYSIKTVNVDRLYVCVEDITPYHCYKITSGTTVVPYKINEIYQPNGSHSCFEELTKFDPKNFSPWGYERVFHYHVNQTNIYPFTNDNTINYIETGSTLNLSFGNLVLYAGNIYRFIYNKPMIYYTGVTGNSNGRIWNSHDTVIALNVNDYKLYKNIRSSVPFSFSDDPITNTYGHWTSLTTGGTVFNATNPFNSYPGPYSGTPRRDFNTAIRLPNLIPADSLGNLKGWKLQELTNVGGSDYDAQVPTGSTGTIASYSTYIDIGEINQINVLKYYKFANSSTYFNTPFVVGDYIMNNSDITHAGFTTNNNLITGYTESSIPNRYYYNINATYNRSYDYDPSGLPGCFVSDYYNENFSPIFEYLCNGSAINCPREFSLTRTYNQYSLYHVYKYAVSRGVLYSYISNVASVMTLLPFQDTANWSKSDFCLVESFKFYKDRTKVSVYESDNYDLTDAVKNNLYIYRNNLTLKPNFTNHDFTGTTINGVVNNGVDARLKNALDKYYDAKDNTLNGVKKYGSVGYRLAGSDIILDYYFDIDVVGLPKTGEFIAKLSISDPCSHSASIIFGILFQSNVALLSTLNSSLMAQNVVSSPSTFVYGYNIRVIVNQNGASPVYAVWTSSSGSVSGSSTLNSGSVFDQVINVAPNDTLTLTFTYSILNSSSIFDSAYYNSVSLFDKTTNNPISTAQVVSSSSISGTNETRTVILPNVTRNELITLNINGLNGTKTSHFTIPNQFTI